MAVKNIEIKKVTKKEQDLQEEVTKLKKDNFNLNNLLFDTNVGLEEVSEVLDVVIDFIREQHGADLRNPISCYNLITFIQRHRIILEMAQKKLDVVNANIEQVL